MRQARKAEIGGGIMSFLKNTRVKDDVEEPKKSSKNENEVTTKKSKRDIKDTWYLKGKQRHRNE